MMSRSALILKMALKENANNMLMVSNSDRNIEVEVNSPENYIPRSSMINLENDQQVLFEEVHLSNVQQEVPMKPDSSEKNIFEGNINQNTDLKPDLQDVSTTPPTCRKKLRKRLALDVTRAAASMSPTTEECSRYSVSELGEEPFEDSGSSYCPSDEDEPSNNTTNRKHRLWSKMTLKTSDNPSGRDAKSNILEKITENSKDYTKKGSKKGKAESSNWRRNKAKAFREVGKEYEGTKRGKNGSKYEKVKKSPRKMGERCNSKKFTISKNRQCSEITDDQRQVLFTKFWSDMNWSQRKTFVAALVNKAPTAQKTNKKKSRRQCSLFYHLKVNDVMLPVCKKMFLSTLSLGERSVINWAKNSHGSGIVTQTSSFPNKQKAINELKRSAIKSFLERLPKLPSHYCRASTSKMYLETVFNSYSEVYELYKKEVDKELICSKTVFMSEMRKLNVDVFQPRKDQCDLCFSFKQGNVSND